MAKRITSISLFGKDYPIPPKGLYAGVPGRGPEGKECRHCDHRQVAEDVKAAGIKDKLSPATINRRLAILRRIANLAHDQWGWLDQQLGNRIKLLRGEKARHIYLTPDQVETLADHCQHPKVALAIRLVARTGLREGELLRADDLAKPPGAASCDRSA